MFAYISILNPKKINDHEGECYNNSKYTLYETVPVLRNDIDHSIADVNIKTRCLQFRPFQCNRDIPTLKGRIK